MHAAVANSFKAAGIENNILYGQLVKQNDFLMTYKMTNIKFV